MLISSGGKVIRVRGDKMRQTPDIIAIVMAIDGKVLPLNSTSK
ncbi:hypothetical protein [Pseudoalteromonas byunsanensis]|nr:hypothetical protein [Pseudoalteromonas byunsanensis]